MSCEAKTLTHGGKRTGAGRKRMKYRLDAPHRSREPFAHSMPIHITMRGQCYINSLRRDTIYRVLVDVLARYRDNRFGGGSFRVIHFSLQDNHLHLIVEATSDYALRRGMRSFAINSARGINAAIGAHGRVWFRFHSTVIKTKRYARNCSAYVLGNWRRHHKDIVNGRTVSAILDRFSSAISFPGWTKRFRLPAGYQPVPVSSPTTSLLRTGWAFDGPLDPHQMPGPLW
ncbi:MAG: transposase [Deltaproteobacteria bacterium]|nr:transposase [Deltaproteobacteria bacterium]